MYEVGEQTNWNEISYVYGALTKLKFQQKVTYLKLFVFYLINFVNYVFSEHQNIHARKELLVQ